MLNVRGSSTNLQVLKSWAGLRKQMGLTTFWKQEHVCLSEKFVGLDFLKETICGPTVCWVLGAMIHLGYQHLSSQQACLAGVLMTFFLQMNKLRLREANYLLSVHTQWASGRLEMESVRLEILALLTPPKIGHSLWHGFWSVSWYPGVPHVFGIETEVPITNTFLSLLAGERYNSTFLWFS